LANYLDVECIQTAAKFPCRKIAEVADQFNIPRNTGTVTFIDKLIIFAGLTVVIFRLIGIFASQGRLLGTKAKVCFSLSLQKPNSEAHCYTLDSLAFGIHLPILSTTNLKH
jgi:hypothetical protein